MLDIRYHMSDSGSLRVRGLFPSQLINSVTPQTLMANATNATANAENPSIKARGKATQAPRLYTPATPANQAIYSIYLTRLSTHPV
uniref:Uncharacterized protein n=1 Tax=Picea glauca TaxID=3330 RepID=A0A101LW30_PICGL|nr:hypothetical protein ABT39_MTgene1503 [Picea glauca]QHR90873.1 hypothetical protein Q903MT_gene4900 [Picea sitchensis]